MFPTCTVHQQTALIGNIHMKISTHHSCPASYVNCTLVNLVNHIQSPRYGMVQRQCKSTLKAGNCHCSTSGGKLSRIISISCDCRVRGPLQQPVEQNWKHWLGRQHVRCQTVRCNAIWNTSLQFTISLYGTIIQSINHCVVMALF